MSCQPTMPDVMLGRSRSRLTRWAGLSICKLLLLLVAVSPLVSSAALTNYLWDGGANGNNDHWAKQKNWAADSEPPANAISGLTNTVITYQGGVRLTPEMDRDYFVNSLIFGPSAGAFTLSSKNTEVLTSGAGGIFNNSVNSQTILSSLNLSNTQTWNASAGNLAIQGGVNLGANGLTFAGSRDVTVGSVIQGSGSVTKQNAGALTLGGAGANTYSGGTTLNGGTITAAKANALGAGPLTINTGNLNIAGFNQTLGTVSLAGGSIAGTSGQLNSSSYQVQSGTVSARSRGPGASIQSGGGVATLTGANVFSGGTVINGGTLAVNNLVGSGTGSGNVTINSGGNLVGMGSISGAVTIQTGGTISAGAGIGLLTTGAEFWLGGSGYRWEIRDTASAAGVGWDLLKVDGALSISATSSDQAFIDVVSFTLGGVPGAASNFDPTQSYVWTIVQTTGGISFAPGESVLTVFELMTGGFANPLSGSSLSVGTANTGKDLTLIYTVPEPDRWMFLVMGICGYLYGRKRSR